MAVEPRQDLARQAQHLNRIVDPVTRPGKLHQSGIETASGQVINRGKSALVPSRTLKLRPRPHARLQVMKTMMRQPSRDHHQPRIRVYQLAELARLPEAVDDVLRLLWCNQSIDPPERARG